MQLVRWKQLRDGNRKHPRQLKQFGVRNPANSALNAGYDSSRNVPASALARGGEVRLRPPFLHPNADDLRADDVAGGFHKGPPTIEVLHLAFVWYSRQCVEFRTSHILPDGYTKT